MVCARSDPVNDKTSFRHKKILHHSAKMGGSSSKRSWTHRPSASGLNGLGGKLTAASRAYKLGTRQDIA